MSSFTKPLIVEHLGTGRWRVAEPFEFWVTEGGERVLVPVGFDTDFASIPRLLWPVFPPAGKWGKAAVIHDKLYRAPVVISDTTSRPIDRAEADRIFLLGMDVLGVPWPVRRLMYRFVRLGSGPIWARYRRNDQLRKAIP